MLHSEYDNTASPPANTWKTKTTIMTTQLNKYISPPLYRPLEFEEQCIVSFQTDSSVKRGGRLNAFGAFEMFGERSPNASNTSHFTDGVSVIQVAPRLQYPITPMPCPDWCGVQQLWRT
jgi:hypothetical protein